jgi:HSP20 family protein
MSWFEKEIIPVTKRAQPGLSSPSPKGNLFSLMDDFFKDRDFSLPSIAHWSEKLSPPLSVSENENAYVVEAELPGVKKKDISVELYDGVLTIKGEKKSFNEEKKDQYYRMERSHGSFVRSIRLPNDVDEQKINAKMDDGVLRVEVSKTADASKKKRSVAIH